MIGSVELWLSLSLIAFVSLYWAVSSEHFLKFHSIRITSDGYIHKIREVPFGPVTAEWEEKIVMPDGKVCPPGGAFGRSTYEDRLTPPAPGGASNGEPVIRADPALPFSEVRYHLGPMAKCVEVGSTYYSSHRVILAGWLKLRPVRVAYEHR